MQQAKTGAATFFLIRGPLGGTDNFAAEGRRILEVGVVDVLLEHRDGALRFECLWPNVDVEAVGKTERMGFETRKSVQAKSRHT